MESHKWGSDNLPVDFELAWDLLRQLEARKSTSPGGIDPRVLGELADVVVRPFCCLSRVLGLWRGPSQLEASKCCSSFQEG